MRTTIIVLKFIINFLYLLAYATALGLAAMCIMMLIICTILGVKNENVDLLVLPVIIGIVWIFSISLEYIQTSRYERTLRFPFPEVGLL